MKKFLASGIFIVVFTAYALYQNFGSSAVISGVQSTSAPATTHVVAVTAAAAPPKKPIASASPASQGAYRDGIYTGTSANAYYGNVQVQVTVANGKITDVTFLNYPQDRGTSRSINSYAMPQLMQEAIAAQSANVNGVSGASDTSAAFKQSLSSALSQAA